MTERLTRGTVTSIPAKGRAGRLGLARILEVTPLPVTATWFDSNGGPLFWWKVGLKAAIF